VILRGEGRQSGGEESNRKKRARKLEGACSWRKKQKAACDHLGEAETKLAARGSRAGPSLPFSGSERSRMRVIDVERTGRNSYLRVCLVGV
jgi:hypothetical protein